MPPPRSFVSTCTSRKCARNSQGTHAPNTHVSQQVPKALYRRLRVVHCRFSRGTKLTSKMQPASLNAYANDGDDEALRTAEPPHLPQSHSTNQTLVHEKSDTRAGESLRALFADHRHHHPLRRASTTNASTVTGEAFTDSYEIKPVARRKLQMESVALYPQRAMTSHSHHPRGKHNVGRACPSFLGSGMSVSNELMAWLWEYDSWLLALTRFPRLRNGCDAK